MNTHTHKRTSLRDAGRKKSVLASENSRHEKHVLHVVMEMSQTQHNSPNQRTRIKKKLFEIE